MAHKNINKNTKESVYYTYLIGWSSLNIWYYGSRYCWGAHPSDLWVTYWTSSKRVANMRELHGEPDVIQIRRIFTCPKKCHNWETCVLKRLNARRHPLMLNGTNNEGVECRTSIGKVLAVDALGNEYLIFKDDQMITMGLAREMTLDEIDERKRRLSLEWRTKNKETINKKQRENYAANKEERNKQQREYRETNREKVTTYQKDYRQLYDDDLKRTRQDYYQRNREEILTTTREYSDANRDRLRIKSKEYRETNPDLVKRQRREYYQRHKEKIKQKAREYREANKKETRNSKKQQTAAV